MKITKTSDEVTYSKVVRDTIFTVGEHTVRVTKWDIEDSETGNYETDTEVNETDLKELTDAEHEAFGENLNDLLDLKVGEETLLDMSEYSNEQI